MDKKKVKLGDEKIKKHQNFDSLFVSYNELTKRNKTPLTKSKKSFLYFLLLAVAAYIILQFT
tara:strand:- start:24 stop:209 length:186 start_codon:yes stop_codon:yes gene_type:complete